MTMGFLNNVFNPREALQKQIMHQLQLSFITWWDKTIGKLDLDDDDRNDADEIKENTLTIIRECSDAYGAADVRKITAGAAAVYQGLNSMKAGVNMPRLLAGLHRASGALQENVKLIGLFIRYQSKKYGVDENAIKAGTVAPPAEAKAAVETSKTKETKATTPPPKGKGK
jgi:hypothetical protein